MGLGLGGQAGRGLFGGEDVMDIGAETLVFLCLFFVFLPLTDIFGGFFLFCCCL